MSSIFATNTELTARLFITSCLILSVIISFTIFKIIVSADVHPNPGPSRPDNSTSSLDLLNKGISIMHLNVQSLKPKLEIIEAEAQYYDILVFTETWLSPNISDDDIMISNFTKPYRADRIGRLGGGVAIYIRDTLISKECYDLRIAGLETLWVEIKIDKHTILLGGFYRPP